MQMEYDLAAKRKEVLTGTTVWVDPENMLRERRSSRTTTHRTPLV